MAQSTRIAVPDASGVGEARRSALRVAVQARLSERVCSEVELASTELATNLANHATKGELIVRALGTTGNSDFKGIELLALDRGPGIADLAAAARDGWSTAGTLGGGIGAISRIASVFDMFTQRGTGTVLVAHVGGDALPSRVPGQTPNVQANGAVSLPMPGEIECGDSWAFEQRGAIGFALVVDGLGHGSFAAEAARAAEVAFHGAIELGPTRALVVVHEALRPTRGAAAAIARIDLGRGVLSFCGVGNIAGFVVTAGVSRHLVSMNGTLGRDAPRFREFDYPWSAEAILVLHSDGLTSKTGIENYPGIARRHPGIIAGLLYRDFARMTDDATVLVIKEVRE